MRSSGIPWGHNVVLVERCKDRAERIGMYESRSRTAGAGTCSYTGSRAISSASGKGQTNFERSLARLQSDLAHEMLKDPYRSSSCRSPREAEEREIESGLVDHIREFLLELGAGFAFVGQQVQLEIGGEDFFVDLLFYHFKLRATS